MVPSRKRPEEDLVDVRGQVHVVEDARRFAVEGHEFIGPVTPQERQRDQHLAQPGQVQEHDRRHQVADRDRLQGVGVDLQFAKIEGQQIALGHHAQHP